MCKYILRIALHVQIYFAYSFAWAKIFCVYLCMCKYILRIVLHLQIYSTYSFACANLFCVKFWTFKYVLRKVWHVQIYTNSVCKTILENFNKNFALSVKKTKYIKNNLLNTNYLEELPFVPLHPPPTNIIELKVLFTYLKVRTYWIQYWN